jgi:phosphoglycolate phosphatase-like HAD superfamily hydrolase
LQQLGESGDNVLAFGNEPCDSAAASKCGITAYNCTWGATDKDKELMQNDREHVSIHDPREIIEILKSTCKST